MLVAFLLLAVTTVDSGSKALEFLGLLGEEDHGNPNQPCICTNHSQVIILLLFPFLVCGICQLSWIVEQIETNLVVLVLAVLSFIGVDCNFCSLAWDFTGSGSKSCHHRLLYAWDDRL